jgi:outer membrane protein assembly factor BamB
LVLTTALFLPGASVRAEYDPVPDEKLLRQAGIATTADGLVGFIRKQSPTEADRRQIDKLVRQLGSSSFEEREAAQRDLVAWGLPALPALKRAIDDPDAEIIRRARECVEQLENGQGVQLQLAATHLLANLKPPTASGALLDFLPHATDASVQDEVFDALAALGATTAPVDAILRAALQDAVPLRRAAVGYVLGRMADQKVRASVHPLLADKEPEVRFRAALGLLAGRDKAAVPVLIDLQTQPPGVMTWQIEDILQRLARDSPPEIPGGYDVLTRQKRRDAWAKWWADQGQTVELARLDERPRFLNITLVPEMHANKVWECDRDGKMLWTLDNLSCPIDAQVLPGNRVLVAELNGNRVSERDRTGKILWEHKVNTPIACQRLTNGHTFIGTNHHLFVVAPDGKEMMSYKPEPGFFIHSVQRQRNGHCVCVSMDGVIREIDPLGKVVRDVPLEIKGGWSGIEGVAGNRYLVCNSSQGRVLEVDAAGKTLWEYTQPGACYASRLPNGNTLVVSNTSGLYEVDAMGKTVWRQQMATSVWRAHRR